MQSSSQPRFPNPCPNCAFLNHHCDIEDIYWCGSHEEDGRTAIVFVFANQQSILLHAGSLIAKHSSVHQAVLWGIKRGLIGKSDADRFLIGLADYVVYDHVKRQWEGIHIWKKK